MSALTVRERVTLLAAVSFFSIALLVFIAVLQLTNMGQKATANSNDGGNIDLVRLYAPSSSSDKLPAKLSEGKDIGDGGLQAETVRFLGSGKEGSFWVGLDQAGNVCLVAEMFEGTLGGSCTGTVQFDQHGTGVMIENHDTGAFLEAHLIPDRAIVDQSAGVSLVVPNVVAFEAVPDGTSEKPISLKVSHGKEVVVPIIGKVPRNMVNHP